MYMVRKMVIIKKQILLALLLLTAAPAAAQDNEPKTTPKATYYNSDGNLQEVTNIDEGEAPLEVTFYANPENMEDYTPAYEWHFQRQGEETDFMVRYEETTTYRFVESGTYNVVLKVTLDDEGTVIENPPIVVTILESKLEFPNAFSPNNGDDFNNIYKAKEGYKSIVEFHAYIFNRWGQKLFEWTDPADGWDGTYKGKDVKEGVYFVLVKAKGADGHVYHIRKDVNLLRGYTESTNNNSGSGY